MIVGGKPGQDNGALARFVEEDIVVSGLGIISPIGLNVKDFASSLSSGQSGLVPANELDKELRADLWAGLGQEL